MGKKPCIFARLSLLFLICSSCAWVGNGAAAHKLWTGPVERRGQVGGAAGAEPAWRRIAGEADDLYPPSPSAEPAHAARDGCRAMITPAPSLLGRQDQGQIQALSNQLQQLSEQSRSVSQSSQQLSQSLQQATQQLSQTQQSLASARLQQSAAESASRSMSQASADASRRAEEASASADRAISQVMQSASQSASRALSSNMASITSSMGASFSSALRLASQSVSDAMRSAASVAQKAQADATALRNEANSQIQQAQGAALTVTQTALAVVGGIIGSSLLTGVGFVLVLRHRRRKRRQQRNDGPNANTGYPQLSSTSNKAYSVASLKKGYAVTSDDDGSSSTYSTDEDNNGFKFPVGTSNNDIQRPLPARVNTITIPPRKKPGSCVGVGYAVSYYSPRTNQRHPSFHLGNPPPPRAADTGTDTGAGAGGGKFALFPSRTVASTMDAGNNLGNATSTSTSTGTSAGEDSSSPPGPEKESSSASGTRVGQLGEGREPRVVSNGAATPTPTPTLERWMRDGTSVSPFSTLKRAPPGPPTGSGLSGLLGGGRRW
ncbi:uncharacterized protein B0T15DRAFT_495054 [Chaetomium strumarium]|uniref:Mid2 domain-containing protein n=1 Tax=Chaetomium strumarium TaxID=1170767 RepID=A0AAJ0GR86_9PEZI|nr:hypothetical protein B0T15DRAFT_495054 [Chaetomium strumarium]